MEKFNSKLLITFLCVFTTIASSCTSELEEYNSYVSSKSLKQSNETFNLENAAYNEFTEFWMIKRKDPYSLENFNKALDNLRSGKSAQNLSSSEADQLSVIEILQPTHYALKIYPRNQEEKRRVIRIKDVKVSNIPFDYVQVPENLSKEVNSMSRSSERTFQEKSPYSITLENYITDEGGPDEPITLNMPILYVVWPYDKPLPEDMDYRIDYEICLPNYHTTVNNVLNDTSIKIIENEAIKLALGDNENSTVRGVNWYFYLIQYDNYWQAWDTPLAQLPVRIQLGSNIWDWASDPNGLVDLDATLNIPSNASVTLRYESPIWELWAGTYMFVPTKSLGSIQDCHARTHNCIDDDYQLNTIHRALTFYFFGLHDIYPKYIAEGFVVRSNYQRNEQAMGLFHYSSDNYCYVEIFNNGYTHNYVVGTVFHELGHAQHYFARGNRFNNFKNTHELLKESYASWAGWHIGNNYYISLMGGGIVKSPEYLSPTYIYLDHVQQSRQDWDPNSDDVYTPLFIDLQDDYNQSRLNDEIKNVPYRNLFHEIIEQCTDWNSCRSILNRYKDQYYSSNIFEDYIQAYDNWFNNH